MQGLLMFILMGLAVWAISKSLGGFEKANQEVFALKPDLFSREGLKGYFTEKKWFSLLILWTFCVPMFPQMFMRFFVSKDLKSLKTSTILYAIVPTFLFICPVIIGVFGHLSFPGLIGKEADQILPMMLMEHTQGWIAALVMVGALAAFMSTLDSQLLALSTMITRDVYLSYINKKADFKKQVLVGRVLVLIAAAIGLGIAYHPPGTLFVIAKQAFTGFSVLFPATIALLHCNRVNITGCITSILLGEAMLAAIYFKIIPNEILMGFDPIVPIMIVTTIPLIIPWPKKNRSSRTEKSILPS
jgi:SSS family solute:Na+ symporter